MTKVLSCLTTTLLTLSFSAGAPAQASEPAGATPATYHLVQVVALSRHGIRAPLVNYGDALAEATPHHWPTWQIQGGLLTPKGGKVESHVGHYFQACLAQNHLFGKRGCPESGAVFAYANSLPRTIDTAKFFLDGAFPGCDIPVNHQAAVGTMDHTFNPIITAAVTEDFKTAALNSIAEHAGPGGVDGLNSWL
ncbi:histidine-type phosphatase [Candidatus Sodalis endolongispinus]|uniref:Histidine-type phosphatase n=1 Tax=Candidatus Sodalis endolongispinus TaxID=2812662 RepID=A0ABS5Y850_9GAMM|nr:histidine-type phosphatase [Candidatus Sodalis endolongispinus]MBT9431136.1 histidine-type phosphatase [Candidatus Sodalis endolongispinus]